MYFLYKRRGQSLYGKGGRPSLEEEQREGGREMRGRIPVDLKAGFNP